MRKKHLSSEVLSSADHVLHVMSGPITDGTPPSLNAKPRYFQERQYVDRVGQLGLQGASMPCKNRPIPISPAGQSRTSNAERLRNAHNRRKICERESMVGQLPVRFGVWEFMDPNFTEIEGVVRNIVGTVRNIVKLPRPTSVSSPSTTHAKDRQKHQFRSASEAQRPDSAPPGLSVPGSKDRFPRSQEWIRSKEWMSNSKEPLAGWTPDGSSPVPTPCIGRPLSGARHYVDSTVPTNTHLTRDGSNMGSTSLLVTGATPPTVRVERGDRDRQRVRRIEVQIDECDESCRSPDTLPNPTDKSQTSSLLHTQTGCDAIKHVEKTAPGPHKPASGPPATEPTQSDTSVDLAQDAILSGDTNAINYSGHDGEMKEGDATPHDMLLHTLSPPRSSSVSSLSCQEESQITHSGISCVLVNGLGQERERSNSREGARGNRSNTGSQIL